MSPLYRAIPVATAQEVDSPTIPHCGRCRVRLGTEDKLKTKNRYWKRCKICRVRNRATKRRSKLPDEVVAAGRNGQGRKLEQPLEVPRAATALAPWRGVGANAVFGASYSAFMVRDRGRANLDSAERIRARYSDLNRKHDRSQPRNSPPILRSRYHALPNISWSPSPSPSIEESFSSELIQLGSDDGEDSPSAQECSVCAESFPPQDFAGLMACAHAPDVCQPCFLAWLDQQLVSTTWESLGCPSSGCKNPVTHEDVQKYAPADVFTHFDDLSMRSLLSNDSHFIYRLAAGCTSGQIHDTSLEGNIFCCAACAFRMCTAHTPPVAFHESETCAQYVARSDHERSERKAREKETAARLRRTQDDASAAAVKGLSVKCPGCGVNIQKSVGCDHMTCGRRVCGFEFCYVCRAPYSGNKGIWKLGNAAHGEECRYHSNKLPGYVGLLVDEI